LILHCIGRFNDIFRIKKGYPYEARVITRVLPTFLADFFPPQDIMNKVIGEFISVIQFKSSEKSIPKTLKFSYLDK
jgi:hypothetical protein